jgi:outer membrane beta-barrel protein
MRKKLILAIVGAGLALSAVAGAEPKRENSLKKDVAVRHRRLLVKNRFEFTPLFESSINADYQHIVGGGAKLEYHFSDMWSIGVVGVGSAALKTSTVNRIVATLQPGPRTSTNPADQREPTAEEYQYHLNSVPFHGAAYLSLTPWYGKLAAFSSAYVAFDFYFQAGVAFAQLGPGPLGDCPTDGTMTPSAQNVCYDTHPGVAITDMNGNTIQPLLNPNLDPPLNTGFRAGLYLGGGIHVFLNDFMALDLTVRDYLFSDNPSGADTTGQLFVGPKDSQFISHLYFGAGVSILFPTTVKRTP